VTPFRLLVGAAFAYATVAALFSGMRLLLAQRFLPFHQQAVGVLWDDIPGRTQLLLLALMRVAGLGSLGAALLALAACAGGSLGLGRIASLVFGLSVVAYWAGLFGVTSHVHGATGAATPYRTCCSVAVVSLAGCLGLLVA